MAGELHPDIARLLVRAHLLPVDEPGPWAAISDAGDTAYRAALRRWAELREAPPGIPYAGIATVLGRCFGDDRALVTLLSTDDERAEREASAEQPTALELVQPWTAGFAGHSPGSGLLASVLGASILELLGSGELPLTSLEALHQVRAEPRQGYFLELRRQVHPAHRDTVRQDEAERFTDIALQAAAAASPNDPRVLQTVLSYWGEAQPLDDVPTADPDPGEAPASWYATCSLIAALRRTQSAEQLVGLAHESDFWRESRRAGDAYVTALESSTAPSAEERLFDISRSETAVAGSAVAAIAARRVRLAGATPILLPRILAVHEALQASGVIDRTPGPRTVQLLTRQATTSDTALDLAVATLTAFGRASTLSALATSGLHALVQQALDALTLIDREPGARYRLVDAGGAAIEASRTGRGGTSTVYLSVSTPLPAALEELVEHARDAGDNRRLRRIRQSRRGTISYAWIDPDTWSEFLDWIAATPLPDPAPVPPPRVRGQGLLGRLFGGS